MVCEKILPILNRICYFKYNDVQHNQVLPYLNEKYQVTRNYVNTTKTKKY